METPEAAGKVFLERLFILKQTVFLEGAARRSVPSPLLPLPALPARLPCSFILLPARVRAVFLISNA